MPRISWPDEELLDSQNGLCSLRYIMEYDHPVQEMYYHTITLYTNYHTITLHTNCTITPSPCTETVLSHNHPVHQITITQSPCIPTVLPQSQCTATVLLHNHPVYQLYYHTITLYSNCTINHPVYQLRYHTITLQTKCTITKSPCIPTVLLHKHPL
jgi:hypothetical protein